MKWYTEHPTKNANALIEVTYAGGSVLLTVGYYEPGGYWAFYDADGYETVAHSHVRWTPITGTNCEWQLLEAPCSDD